MVSTWYYIAVGILFAYLLFGNSTKAPPGRMLRSPLAWYCSAMFIEAGFTVFRAGNASTPRNLIVAEYWANGLQWLVVAVAVFKLSKLIGSDGDSADGEVEIRG